VKREAGSHRRCFEGTLHRASQVKWIIARKLKGAHPFFEGSAFQIPRGIRTPDRPLSRRLLYPAELRDQIDFSNPIPAFRGL
jgi:hypothetical protein